MVCILLKKVGLRPGHIFWDNPWFQPPWQRWRIRFYTLSLENTIFFGRFCWNLPEKNREFGILPRSQKVFANWETHKLGGTTVPQSFTSSDMNLKQFWCPKWLGQKFCHKKATLMFLSKVRFRYLKSKKLPLKQFSSRIAYISSWHQSFLPNYRAE